MTYTAIVTREDGWYIITVPELPFGRVTQARTRREVPVMTADLIGTPAEVRYEMDGETFIA